ncbi:cupin domain-containing protein [Pectobacterium parvum]|uniref:cupin domain-containing protein n=1 Tax=Pectobacterium parvum TaxID=2778550 RepID=UPI001E2AE55C|nr:cupin domain-containing protein [Pectobacterium parvum]UFK41095.1 cupin domain-containing protein [Pectobacterium parvum]GKW44180.1 hypothetical protein PEC301879_40380 [Pectobacterium carotovorum subsp. carotovorum]
MLKSNAFAEYIDGKLVFDDSEKKFRMANSFGTGIPLVKHDQFGADLIRFEAGKGVGNHIHDGDHILFVLSGSGYVVYAGEAKKLEPGICYLIEGEIDHAIKAETDLLMIAVGNAHFDVDSKSRMTPVPYRDETAQKYRIHSN